jgi:hypothetical protein
MTATRSPREAAIRVKLDSHLRGAGSYVIEFDPAPGDFVAQLAATYYEPWDQAELPSSHLALHVEHDRWTLGLDETVTTFVEVSRTRYGGMLTASIGLPPGAQVDPLSIRGASHYELHADRLVLYAWPDSSRGKSVPGRALRR